MRDKPFMLLDFAYGSLNKKGAKPTRVLEQLESPQFVTEMAARGPGVAS